jgi:ADP-ribose pyrophosphatase
MDAAKRELLEETGYEATDWISLGSYRVGANRGIAMAHLFLAADAYYVKEPDSDDLEEQELVHLTRIELEAALAEGRFKVLAWATVVSLGLQCLERKETLGNG